MAGAILSFVLLHGVDAFNTLQKLPSKASETGQQFRRWLYDDVKWKGQWSSRAEGEIEDRHLAEQPVLLSLEVEQGHALGELYLSTVCDRAPLLLPVFVDGEVSVFGHLSAVAYSYVGGEKRTLLTFRAKLKDDVLQLEAISDPSKFVLGPARLSSFDPNSANHPDLQCKSDPLKAVLQVIERAHTPQVTK